MLDALKEAATLCKSLFRNGYDAHVINAPLQQHLLGHADKLAVDLACEASYPVLVKVFPECKPASEDSRLTGILEKNGVLYRFYPLSVENSEHPELSLMRLTPTMAQTMTAEDRLNLRLTGFGGPAISDEPRPYDGFEPLACGEVKLAGLPEAVLPVMIASCFFCMGICTLLQTTIGNRLPLVQGPSSALVSSMGSVTAAYGMPAMWGAVIIRGQAVWWAPLERSPLTYLRHSAPRRPQMEVGRSKGMTFCSLHLSSMAVMPASIQSSTSSSRSVRMSTAWTSSLMHSSITLALFSAVSTMHFICPSSGSACMALTALLWGR